MQGFPVQLQSRMEQVANHYQASAFHVLLAAMYVYFTRTSQRQEWAVGLPILNRSNARFRATVEPVHPGQRGTFCVQRGRVFRCPGAWHS